MRKFTACIFIAMSFAAVGQDIKNNPTSNHGNRFEQLGTILPTPNEYRTASGTTGAKYWQQRADYKINCRLDEKKLELHGTETITYFNNSPDVLTYIWLQLDENEHDPNSQNVVFDESRVQRTMGTNEVKALNKKEALEGFGEKIESITDAFGKPMKYTINQTMMRVELPLPLKTGLQFKFNVKWHYKIPDRVTLAGRGGYELFAEDGNHLFTISQWYPRLCVYSDFQGWQNHQFTGRGEFALAFGNFDVEITVPADHLVAATGECSNYAQVLTAEQLKRWNKAQTAKDVVEIGLLSDAVAAEKTKATTTKIWKYKATNVRDFAWTSSRKYIWDAMPTVVEGKKIMCMSFYPKEAYNLWRKYSTKVVAHTIKSYSKFSVPYPYPVAQSIEADNGMEYPMICFNNGRCAKDGTYSESTKYSMIGVIIHEVGHNFFPMIVNSDERQWSWMDEGLNTFGQYLTEQLFDNKYNSSRGPAYKITDYMKMPKEQLEPIMTNSENIINFGANAYGKPATGLNILRETIMGRELFDYAFKEYSRRWAFKHPTPADFFRTMEDASAVDLDWFWRGWFYGIEPCDIALDSVKVFKPSGGPIVADTGMAASPRGRRGGRANDSIRIPKPNTYTFEDISKIRNREDKSITFAADADTSLRDFYWYYARGQKQVDTTALPPVISKPEPADSADVELLKNKWVYQLSFTNKGGLVMPLIIEWTYADSTKEVEKIAAEIWRKNEKQITKSFIKSKEVVSIVQDPMRETADIDENNNVWPVKEEPTRLQLFKSTRGSRRSVPDGPNPMQREIK
jgi:Peptidase family M1 domain